MKTNLKLMFVGLAMTGLVTSCKQKGASEMTKSDSYEDTAGLAQFQAWKAQNERKDASEYNAGAVASKPVRRTTSTAQPVATTTTTTTQPAETKKKGWSKAAKGTAIGAGSGAVLGAVVNKKNRAVGAVIGGVVGGGVGYGVGRAQDKKDGRVN